MIKKCVIQTHILIWSCKNARGIISYRQTAIGSFSLLGSRNILENFGFCEKSLKFNTLNRSLDDCTCCVASEHSNFKLISVGFVHVHRFAESFGCEDSRFLQSHVLPVVVFQWANGINAVFTSGMSHPCCVVAGGVRAVELEALDGVIAGVH